MADPSGIVSGTTTPSTDTTALADAKAKFNELLAKQKAEPDLNEVKFEGQETPSGKRGKPAKAPQKAAAPPEPEEAEEATPEEKPAQKAPEKRSEADKLRAKLLLAGNPKRAIESLSDDEVGEWWKKQEEREQATALALQRASDLEKRLPKETTSQESEPQAGVPTDELDLDELKASLVDQFGEEEAGTLAKVLSAAIEPLRKENSEIRTILENARRQGIEQIEKSNRARLGEKLDMLKESDRAWKILNAAAHEEFKRDSKRFTSPEAVYDEVFDGIYGELLTEKAPAPSKDEAEEKARIAAASHTPPASTKRQRSLRPEDAHRAAYEHLAKNPDDTEGARRVYGRYPIQ